MKAMPENTEDHLYASNYRSAEEAKPNNPFLDLPGFPAPGSDRGCYLLPILEAKKQISPGLHGAQGDPATWV